MINKWDKMIYDHYLKSHQLRKRMGGSNPALDEGETYDLINRVYKADFTKKDDTSDTVEKIVDSPHFKLAAQSAAHHGQRTLDLVDVTMKALIDIDTDSDEKVGDLSSKGARLKNLLKGDKFSKDVADAQKAAAFTEDLLGGGKGSSGGMESDAELEERQELMRIIQHERFRTILNLFGEFKKHLNKIERSKFMPNNHIICDVELGNNFEKLLPDEFMKFIPELEFLGNLQYVNEELLQFKTGADEPVGKGDVTVLVDTSSSMGGAFPEHSVSGGRRSDYAVACALAIHHAVTSNGRKCRLLVFDGDCREVSAVQLIRTQPSGCTDINKALRVAMMGANRDDILLITDGEDSVNQIEKDNVRLYGLGIGFGNGPNDFEKVCDSFFKADTIEDFKSLSEVVFQ